MAHYNQLALHAEELHFYPFKKVQKYIFPAIGILIAAAALGNQDQISLYTESADKDKPIFIKLNPWPSKLDAKLVQTTIIYKMLRLNIIRNTVTSANRKPDKNRKLIFKNDIIISYCKKKKKNSNGCLKILFMSALKEQILTE